MTPKHRCTPTHCTILPPHILRAVSRNGSDSQREAALRTIAQDTTFRALRAAGGLSLDPAALAQGAHVAAAAKKRTIYDAQGSESLPGKLVRAEGAPKMKDAAVDEAYDGFGATFDFYQDCYGRNSIDDEGLALDGTVHYGRYYDNAFWDGRRMVFGDGDGQLFNRFTISLDIIGHELTHGVTQDEAGLAYLFQPGALNESISDVFGSLVRQKVLKQTASQADWLIGAGLFTPNVQGQALRSMKAPGTAYNDPVLGQDPQPAHMNNFVHTYEDNGGVHINSGIPNHAFFLVATGIGGYAWERAGLIWYETLRDSRIRQNTGFGRFARLTLNAADKLFGVGSAEHEIVQGAWAQVGIKVK